MLLSDAGRGVWGIRIINKTSFFEHKEKSCKLRFLHSNITLFSHRSITVSASPPLYPNRMWLSFTLTFNLPFPTASQPPQDTVRPLTEVGHERAIQNPVVGLT